MNDKDFLYYFDQLSNKKEDLRLKASENILKTLLA